MAGVQDANHSHPEACSEPPSNRRVAARDNARCSPLPTPRTHGSRIARAFSQQQPFQTQRRHVRRDAAIRGSAMARHTRAQLLSPGRPCRAPSTRRERTAQLCGSSRDATAIRIKVPPSRLGSAQQVLASLWSFLQGNGVLMRAQRGAPQSLSW
eukprot:CAMPEP_0179850902 /NCGR_PEP_ID=MMETSP0982-20121206/7961_1 /TAXON_ID=483367 /ORGANISM="non described non described, Strain CCMP 2436" /LENGTH=153 /DNA_ID=CAMNT_0021736379 /DNA_START=560 /DNA_END=1021 /DNA_ORIENTATION=-